MLHDRPRHKLLIRWVCPSSSFSFTSPLSRSFLRLPCFFTLLLALLLISFSCIFSLQGVLYPLYVLAEIAIIATDLAELLGSAIALNLYISVPEPDGIDVEGMLIIVSIFSI
jgi:hypothetical protein